MTSGIVPVYINSEILDSTLDFDSIKSRSSSYKTREAYIRAEIMRMTKQESKISGLYKQLLRSIINHFSDLVCVDSEAKVIEVKCIFANPERVVASLKQENNIILPIISISQDSSQTDPSRGRYKSHLVHEVMYDREKNRATRVLSIAPVPVDITYSVNLWCKYREDLDQLTEQVRLKFNPNADLVIENHDLVVAFLEEADSIEGAASEVGDREDRILKKTFKVNVKTYINNPKFLLTSTGAIERIILDF